MNDPLLIKKIEIDEDTLKAIKTWKEMQERILGVHRIPGEIT